MSLPAVNGEFRIAADPELRFAPSGVAVCNLRAVATKRKKDGDNWVDGNTCWVNLTCFKQMAENVAESLQKGHLVTVTGEIETQEWEDREGQKRTSLNILVSSIGPSLSWDTAVVQKRESGGNGGGGQQQSRGNQQRGSNSGGQRQSDPSNDPWATGDPNEPPF